MQKLQEKTMKETVVEEYQKLENDFTKPEIYKKIKSNHPKFPGPSIRRIISMYTRNQNG